MQPPGYEDKYFVKVRNANDPAYQFNKHGMAAQFGVNANLLVHFPLFDDRPLRRTDNEPGRIYTGMLSFKVDTRQPARSAILATDEATFRQMVAKRPDLILRASKGDLLKVI